MMFRNYLKRQLERLFGWLEPKLFDRNLLRHGDTYDKTLLWVLLSLMCFGLVMVYSASATQMDMHRFDNRMIFLVKQMQFVALGLLISCILIRVPLWRWQRWDRYLFAISLISLAIVVFFGEEVNGARRWLPMPFGFKVQPSELFKLVTIVYMANFFRRKLTTIKELWRILLVGIPIIVGCTLIYNTRDLGTVVVVMSIFIALLWLTNVPKKWVFGAISITVLLGIAAIRASDYRMRRIEVMWKPWEDETGAGFQGMGSLMSFQHGSFFGRGLGNAVFKRGFLPEAHTDFIFAVIGEELGLITVSVLVLVYVWIIWRAFSIGKQARDLELYFNSFVAVGIGVWIAAQAFINMGVNISLLPNKGLTLPLISYGGSSLVVMMIALTMLLRVDYENRRALRGFDVSDPKQPAPIAKTQPEPESNEIPESSAKA